MIIPSFARARQRADLNAPDRRASKASTVTLSSNTASPTPLVPTVCVGRRHYLDVRLPAGRLHPCRSSPRVSPRPDTHNVRKDVANAHHFVPISRHHIGA